MSNAWSAFYWRDYLADTGHLTLAQHGAYLLLMAHYYRTRRPLPANASILHRVCRCTTDADKLAMDEVLSEFFVADGDVYRHSRIDQELAKAVDISEKRRSAANAKHHRSKAANALQMHTQPQPQPHTTKKQPSRSDEREPCDPRHSQLRDLIRKLQRETDVPEQWNGRCGKELSVWLRANPNVGLEQAASLVRNRFASDEPLGAPPWEWIPKLSRYWDGPLDKYKNTYRPDFRAGYEGIRAAK